MTWILLTRLRYTWSSVIATMFIAAADLAAYWGLVKTWQIVIFYFVCPMTIGAINWLGVKVPLPVSFLRHLAHENSGTDGSKVSPAS
jgi:hypothetical protein